MTSEEGSDEVWLPTSSDANEEFQDLDPWVEYAKQQEVKRRRLLKVHRLVTGYGMIGMIGIPKEYGRYIHSYTYSMHIC